MPETKPSSGGCYLIPSWWAEPRFNLSEIAHFLKVPIATIHLWIKLARATGVEVGEPIRLTTGRLDNDGGFAVELRPWLREAILEGAVAALRGKLENDLAALAKDAVRAEDDTLPVALPPPDAAALPEQLMG